MHNGGGDGNAGSDVCGLDAERRTVMQKIVNRILHALAQEGIKFACWYYIGDRVINWEMSWRYDTPVSETTVLTNGAKLTGTLEIDVNNNPDIYAAQLIDALISHRGKKRPW